MGQILTALKCCCTGNKPPELKINVSSNCCQQQGNRYQITISDEVEIEKLNEILKELHKNSIKKNIQHLNNY